MPTGSIDGLFAPSISLGVAWHCKPHTHTHTHTRTRTHTHTHTRTKAEGTALFTDDMPVEEGTLYGAYVCARVAVGKVAAIDTAAALQLPGAVQFVGAADVPGLNVVGGGVPRSGSAGLVGFVGEMGWWRKASWLLPGGCCLAFLGALDSSHRLWQPMCAGRGNHVDPRPAAQRRGACVCHGCAVLWRAGE